MKYSLVIAAFLAGALGAPLSPANMEPGSQTVDADYPDDETGADRLIPEMASDLDPTRFTFTLNKRDAAGGGGVPGGGPVGEPERAEGVADVDGSRNGRGRGKKGGLLPLGNLGI